MGFLALVILLPFWGGICLGLGAALENFWVGGILFALPLVFLVRSLTKRKPKEWHLADQDRPVDTTVIFAPTQNNFHFYLDK